jgi:predicted transcriptional regulator
MPQQSSSPSLRNLLGRIGLEEREIEIYLALLPMKVARASTVARAAKQSRSHAYLVLRSLQEKGLVAEVERGKVLHFVAEKPERLLQYVENREEELHALKPLIEGALPLLRSLESPLAGRPRVTLLHGIEGMKQVYRDTLPREFCAFFNPEAMYGAFGRNVVTMLFGKTGRLRGRDLLVDSPAAMRFIAEVVQDEDYEVRLLPKGVTFQADTIVHDDTVAFFAYDDEKTIVRIENPEIAASVRAWFDALWSVGRRSG